MDDHFTKKFTKLSSSCWMGSRNLYKIEIYKDSIELDKIESDIRSKYKLCKIGKRELMEFKTTDDYSSYPLCFNIKPWNGKNFDRL